MPMLNADEWSPLDAAINTLGELSIERYFAGSPPAVSILPERESELHEAEFLPGVETCRIG